MSDEHPQVIVTGPDKLLPFGWWTTRFVLKTLGITPVYITPQKPRLPESISGIVIGGGDDIEPSHYGITGDAGSNYDPERDALEINIIQRALESNVPVLGICRGAQLMNVVMGGSLYQDIRPLRQKTPNKNTVFTVKNVNILSGSILYDAIGQESVKVNSLHKQAVKDLAKSLAAVAYDEDRFIQAIEHKDKPFFLGVQWHPEYLFYHPSHWNVFKQFSAAVKQNFGL